MKIKQARTSRTTGVVTSESARGVTVIVVGNGHGVLGSNPERAWISRRVNTFKKDMNPAVLLPAKGK